LLDGLGVLLALRRGAVLRFDQQRRHEPALEVREGQPLCRLPTITAGYREVDQRVLGMPPIHRERRDAHARDQREREEVLAQDVAERLETRDGLPDPIKPTVRANQLQR
jgi:hypothetical protein